MLEPSFYLNFTQTQQSESWEIFWEIVFILIWTFLLFIFKTIFCRCTFSSVSLHRWSQYKLLPKLPKPPLLLKLLRSRRPPRWHLSRCTYVHGWPPGSRPAPTVKRRMKTWPTSSRPSPDQSSSEWLCRHAVHFVYWLNIKSRFS